MIEKGRNIEPLPKVEFIDGDIENAKEFFEINFGWTLKKNVDVKEKLAWALLNIGLFLEMEGKLK